MLQPKPRFNRGLIILLASVVLFTGYCIANSIYHASIERAITDDVEDRIDDYTNEQQDAGELPNNTDFHDCRITNILTSDNYASVQCEYTLIDNDNDNEYEYKYSMFFCYEKNGSDWEYVFMKQDYYGGGLIE